MFIKCECKKEQADDENVDDTGLLLLEIHTLGAKTTRHAVL